MIINSGIPLGPHLLRIKLSLRQAEMEGEIQNLQDAKGFLNKLYLRETHLIQGHISKIKISRIINSDSDLPSWSKKLSEEIRWMLFTWPVELIKTYYDNNPLSKVFPELAEAEDSVKSTQFHFVEGFLNDTTLALSILCEEIALPTPVQILSLLFLDIGKSKTKGIKPDGSTTYYGHERAGAEIAQR